MGLDEGIVEIKNGKSLYLQYFTQLGEKPFEGLNNLYGSWVLFVTQNTMSTDLH